MGSFNDADEILKAGIDEGKRPYPRFKHLADSLNEKYGKQETVSNRLPVVQTVRIDSMEVTGLINTTKTFFVNTMDFKLHKDYKATELTEMIRTAFGTRYYNRIVYSLVHHPDGTCKIILYTRSATKN